MARTSTATTTKSKSKAPIKMSISIELSEMFPDVKGKPGSQSYLKNIVKAIDKSEEAWDEMSEEAKVWYTEAVEAIGASEPVSDFEANSDDEAEAEDEDEDEDEDAPKSKAKTVAKGKARKGTKDAPSKREKGKPSDSAFVRALVCKNPATTQEALEKALAKANRKMDGKEAWAVRGSVLKVLRSYAAATETEIEGLDS